MLATLLEPVCFPSLIRRRLRLWSSRYFCSPVHAGVVATVLADGVAQAVQHRQAGGLPGRHNWAQTARLCTYSALIGTPVAHWWFGWLDKVGRALAFRVLVDGLRAPLLYVHTVEAIATRSCKVNFGMLSWCSRGLMACCHGAPAASWHAVMVLPRPHGMLSWCSRGLMACCPEVLPRQCLLS